MDCSKEGFIVRRLSQNEIPAALWEVFSEYESPDYAPEGTEEFRKCLHDEKYLDGIEYYGTFDGEKLIGIIGIRADKKHICFFLYGRKSLVSGHDTNRITDVTMRFFPSSWFFDTFKLPIGNIL